MGVAFLAFLELGSIDSLSAGPCLETYLGETFLLETVFLEGVLWVGGACLALGAAGAMPSPLTGEVSEQERPGASPVLHGCSQYPSQESSLGRKQSAQLVWAPVWKDQLI